MAAAATGAAVTEVVAQEETKVETVRIATSATAVGGEAAPATGGSEKAAADVAAPVAAAAATESGERVAADVAAPAAAAATATKDAVKKDVAEVVDESGEKKAVGVAVAVPEVPKAEVRYA